MINEKYLNQALRIRKDFLSTDDELLILSNKLKSINEDIQKTLKQLIGIRENSDEYTTDDKFQTDIIECLKDFEIQSKKVSEVYEPLNNKMENLKKEEEDLYDSLTKEYPNISEKELVEEVQNYLKNKIITE